MIGIGDQHTELRRACWSITGLDRGVGAGRSVYPPRAAPRYSGTAGRHGIKEEMHMLTGHLRREARRLEADTVALTGYADGGDLDGWTAGRATITLDNGQEELVGRFLDSRRIRQQRKLGEARCRSSTDKACLATFLAATQPGVAPLCAIPGIEAQRLCACLAQGILPIAQGNGDCLAQGEIGQPLVVLVAIQAEGAPGVLLATGQRIGRRTQFIEH